MPETEPGGINRYLWQVKNSAFLNLYSTKELEAVYPIGSFLNENYELTSETSADVIWKIVGIESITYKQNLSVPAII